MERKSIVNEVLSATVLLAASVGGVATVGAETVPIRIVAETPGIPLGSLKEQEFVQDGNVSETGLPITPNWLNRHMRRGNLTDNDRSYLSMRRRAL